MATTAKPEESIDNATRRKQIISDLRSKMRTSKTLVADVEQALIDLERVSPDDAVYVLPPLFDFIEFIEDIVNDTPDANLRERLLGIRMVIAAHPKISLENLRRLA